MKLKKLPSSIIKNHFDYRGLIKKDHRWLVPAYVGSQFGFNEPGRIFLNQYFYPRLEKEAGVYPLCPFKACNEYLGGIPKQTTNIKNQLSFWNRFNQLVGCVNVEYLMPRSKFMIALIEGHNLDDGLCSEIADFARTFGPVIGIRSDARLAENIAAPINPAVRYYMDLGPFKGCFLNGPRAYIIAIKAIKDLADAYRK